MAEERMEDNIKDEDGQDLPWLQPVEEESEESWLSARTLIMAAAVFVVIFVALLWVIYAQLSGEEEPQRVVANTDLPVIEAPNEPHKITPDDPGGAEIPGQDKLVLDAANGAETKADTILAEPAEKPVERETSGGFVEQQAPPPPRPSVAQVETQPAPQREPVAAQPVPEAVQQNVAGRYLIQLGAFSSDARARTGWTQVQEKYPNIVGDLNIDTQIATVNGRTIYRLRAAALPSREEADRRCAALKAAGQGCLVTER